MYGVVDFYERLDRAEAKRYARGQLWWACYPYAPNDPYVTRFWPDLPTERLDVRRFNPGRERRDEVAGTSADEFLAIGRQEQHPINGAPSQQPPASSQQRQASAQQRRERREHRPADPGQRPESPGDGSASARQRRESARQRLARA